MDRKKPYTVQAKWTPFLDRGGIRFPKISGSDMWRSSGEGRQDGVGRIIAGPGILGGGFTHTLCTPIASWGRWWLPHGVVPYPYPAKRDLRRLNLASQP